MAFLFARSVPARKRQNVGKPTATASEVNVLLLKRKHNRLEWVNAKEEWKMGDSDIRASWRWLFVICCSDLKHVETV